MLNFGDQIANELFSPCSTASTMTWSIQWQEAGYGPWHKVGYYVPGDPMSVTWIVGGRNSGLGSSATFIAPSVFGLAVYSGDTRSNTGGTVYYSQSTLNPGGLDHLASFVERGPNKPEGLCSIIVSWEDLARLGDKDYNDIGVLMRGVGTSVIPTPAAAALALAGGVLVTRRRRIN